MTDRYISVDLNRYPFQPVDELFYADDRLRDPSSDLVRGDEQLAQAIGVTRRTIYRWRVTGLQWWQADTVAVRLGRHVADLWPEWYSQTPGERAPKPADIPLPNDMRVAA